MKRVILRRDIGFPKEMDNKVFVHRMSLPIQAGKETRPFQIKLIGISHGQMPLYPVGIGTARILKKELAAEKGLILAESADRNFVPRKYVKQTIPIESKIYKPDVLHYLLGQAPLTTTIKVFLKGIMPPSYLQEFFHKVEKIEGLAPRLVLHKDFSKDPEVEKFCKELKITPKQFELGAKLLITVTSLINASNIMADVMALKHRKSATVVVGLGHMAEVQLFLSKPRLALRYTKIVKNALQNIEGRGGILRELSRAEWTFSQASRENKQSH